MYYVLFIIGEVKYRHLASGERCQATGGRKWRQGEGENTEQLNNRTNEC